MIERWLVAVRDHPGRPPQTQCHVLTMLALRTDWATGRGYASVRQLGQDAAVSEPTVRRATRWAREAGYLLRTRRGHRVSSELTVASEWCLTQPLTGELLGKPTDQNGRPNRSIVPTQPITTDAPSRTVSSRPVTSARARERTEDQTRPANPRTEACKSGDHQLCLFSWCTCACGHRGRQP